jgi:hypothetical protein
MVTSNHGFSNKIIGELENKIAKKSKIDSNEIHLDTSTTNSIPIADKNILLSYVSIGSASDITIIDPFIYLQYKIQLVFHILS